MGNVAMNNYSASDGKRFWVVGLGGMRHWPRARAVGAKTGSTTSVTPIPNRARNAAEIIAQLDEIFATKTMASGKRCSRLEPDFFWAPVNSPDDLLADPQFYASGALVEVPDGTSTTNMIATPADFPNSMGPRSTAPNLGQHTVEILTELGRSDQIEALVDPERSEPRRHLRRLSPCTGGGCAS